MAGIEARLLVHAHLIAEIASLLRIERCPRERIYQRWRGAARRPARHRCDLGNDDRVPLESVIESPGIRIHPEPPLSSAGKTHFMNIPRIAAQEWLRAPGASADTERPRRPEKPDHQEPWRLALPAPWLAAPSRLISLARLAPLLACAGVLTTSGAAAQATDDAQPAPPPEESPEASAPPPEGSPEATAPEGSPEAVDSEGSPEAVDSEYDVEVEEAEMAEVVVTGFQRSLGAALLRKQRSTGQVDAIVAEDIADFPDLNLAESLQRIPGVSITRVNGEGSQITVRGLSGLYTRVRVNGMETRAAVGDNNANNNGRSFDFNLFASELFNSIVVHKTASADLDEGSLGAVVDLNTARAFNYDEGFTFVAGATGAYNDLSNTVRPRLTGLIAYRDPGGIWGATASAAYTRARLDVASTDTVRWQTGGFNSVNGVICADNPTDPGCAEVAAAQHPRIPRYGEQVNTGERLGLTAGIQLRPTDMTDIRLDGLYATYDTEVDLKWLELLFRGNEGGMDITDYTLKSFPERFGESNNSLIAASVNNAWVRSERNRLNSENTFHQLSLSLDHRFSDLFFVNALAGTSRSGSGLPHDSTVSYDIRNYNGYRYDYSDDQYPLLQFNGPDVTNAANFTATELRDRVSKIEGGFDTAELNLHFDLLEELKLATGVNYKRATLDRNESNRDGTICGLDLFDCDTDDDGTDDVLGAPGDPALSEAVEYPGEVGAGSNTRWTTPDIDAWNAALGYSNVPLSLDQDSTWKVTEKNLGTFLQARGEIMLGSEDSDMRLLYDAGVRYVETRQTSTGYNSGVSITIDRPTYHDWLPSANTALWLTEEWVVRLAAARVMARPSLADLSPGGTVDSFGYEVDFQNPNLNPTRATALDAAIEWYFSENSLLSLAVFWKDIESFPIRQSRTGTFASTGLPRSLIAPTSPADMSPNQEGTCADPVAGCWQITQLANGPGSTIMGLELGFQAPFRAFSGGLPVVLRDMGVVANYTFVDSEADYDFSGNTVTERLIGLSNGSYNATLYYDDSVFNARASLAYRSDYLIEGPNRTGNLWEYVESETRLDFSSGYNVTDNLKISLEALNLLDTAFATKVDVDAERRVLYNKTGRTFLLGARVSY
jgi:iron complex outermembrane recepter protein